MLKILHSSVPLLLVGKPSPISSSREVHEADHEEQSLGCPSKKPVFVAFGPADEVVLSDVLISSPPSGVLVWTLLPWILSLTMLCPAPPTLWVEHPSNISFWVSTLSLFLKAALCEMMPEL